MQSYAVMGPRPGLGKIHLPGVARSKSIFSPVARARKSVLNPSTESWLTSKSGNKSSSSRGSCAAKPVQETQRDFKLVVGDNLAECILLP